MNLAKDLIPEDFTDFLYLIKEKTEAFWSKVPTTPAEKSHLKKWQYGARWLGLTDPEINELEKKYEIKFAEEHRAFLRILHTIDRNELYEYEEEGQLLTIEAPFFYNWQTDDKYLQKYLAWPLDTILEDINGYNKVWLTSWGNRPTSVIKQEEIVKEWYKNAPPLLPLTSHRFLVSDDQLQYKPVLSMYGSDIIIMNWSFKTFLLDQFKIELGLGNWRYDEEDRYWSYESEMIKYDKECKYGIDKRIPSWEEMILYSSTGWAGFGLKFPRIQNHWTCQL